MLRKLAKPVTGGEPAGLSLFYFKEKCMLPQKKFSTFSEQVEWLQDAYEATLKAYNAGTQERLELQDSEQQLNQAKLGLMNEKFNYISALLDLETKLNIKLR